MSLVFNKKNVIWMFENAPIKLQNEVVKLLGDTMAKELADYSEASSRGYVDAVDCVEQSLKAELRALHTLDENFVYHTRKLSTFVYNALKDCRSPNAYVRLCAFSNPNLTVTFVGKDGKSTSSYPAVFTDLEELSHVLSKATPGVFFYYKTVYLKLDGKYTFV